jgi:hypothetical protein
VSAFIVLIGPSEALPGLKARSDADAEIQAFKSADAVEALEHIVRTRPPIVALEAEFSVSARGSALIKRIIDDPVLASCEVRVVARDGGVQRVTTGGGAATAVALDDRAPLLDQRGTRRAPRYRMKSGLDVTIDGNPATLVDLSRVGAQITAHTVLRPNQRVRLILMDGTTQIRCAGALAWAWFEMPKGVPPQYRTGLDFSSPDADAIDGYLMKYRGD